MLQQRKSCSATSTERLHGVRQKSPDFLTDTSNSFRLMLCTKNMSPKKSAHSSRHLSPDTRTAASQCLTSINNFLLIVLNDYFTERHNKKISSQDSALRHHCII